MEIRSCSERSSIFWPHPFSWYVQKVFKISHITYYIKWSVGYRKIEYDTKRKIRFLIPKNPIRAQWEKANPKSLLTMRDLPSLGLLHSANTIKNSSKSVIFCTTPSVLLGIVRLCKILYGKYDSWYFKLGSEPDEKRGKLIENPFSRWKIVHL